MVEKVIKSFEVLNLLSHHDTIMEDTISLNLKGMSGKDIVGHLNIITDALLSDQCRRSREHGKWLSASVQMFLHCCDDEQHNVRIVAEESLNHLLKSLQHTQLARMQVDLFREVRRGSRPRSLRVALRWFSRFSAHIRPQKRRAYVASLVMCLKAMVEGAEEESLHVLASCTAAIFPVFMPLVSDSEATVLLNCLLKKASDGCAVVRRSAAILLCRIVVHCRRLPSCLLHMLADNLESAEDGAELGWLVCTRTLFAGLSSETLSETPALPSHTILHNHLLFRVLGSCLEVCRRKDHNVVTGALECLLQLFKASSDSFLFLLCQGSLSKDQNPTACGKLMRILLGGGVPMILNVARFICGEFLVNGEGEKYGDDEVRISIKVLAINLLSLLTPIYPAIFHSYLFHQKSLTHHSTTICIHHTMQYTTHADPNLRGSTYLFIATSISISSFSSYFKRISVLTHNFPPLESLVAVLVSGLTDESSIGVRCSLQALRGVLPLLLSKSSLPGMAFNALLTILQTCLPNYWLVKIECLGLLSDIDYRSIEYLEALQNTQLHYKQYASMKAWVIGGVAMESLVDEDHRVRTAAITALIKLIEDSGRIGDHSSLHNTLLSDKTSFSPSQHLQCDTFCDNLTTVVSLVSRVVLSSTSKFSMLGACSLLSELSRRYPPHKYPHSWFVCFDKQVSTSADSQEGSKHNQEMKLDIQTDSNSAEKHEVMTTDKVPLMPINNTNQSTLPSHLNPFNGLLCHLISLLTTSPLTLSLTIQTDATKVATSLLIGSFNASDSSSNSVSKQLSQQLITHLFRLLTSVTQLIEMEYMGKPGVTASTPFSTLSPIKRRLKSTKETRTFASSFQSKAKDELTSQKWKEKISSPSTPQNLQLFQLIKKNLRSYLISDEYGDNKVVLLMRSLLQCISALLQKLQLGGVELQLGGVELQLGGVELQLGGVEWCLQELLACLMSCFVLDASCTVATTLQLLETLFTSASMNVASSSETKTATSEFSRDHSGNISFPDKVNKNFKSDKSKLAQSIKLFEPLVIMALKHFTTSCHTHFQIQVLDLLSFLVNVKVNYNLLDSDQIFLNFIFKQIESFEITSNKGEKEQLMAAIFHFLSLLSGEAVQRGTLVSLPRLIRLFDSLLASDLDVDQCIPCLSDIIRCLFSTTTFSTSLPSDASETHQSSSFPHLKSSLSPLSYSSSSSPPSLTSSPSSQTSSSPIFQSLSSFQPSFTTLSQSSSSSLPLESSYLKELETQKEVVLSMLLKLLHNTKILSFVCTVLKDAKNESEEKWKRISRQVFEHFHHLLIQQKITITSLADLNEIHRLFEHLSLCVYRSSDLILQFILFRLHFNNMEDLIGGMVLMSCYLRLLPSLSKAPFLMHKVHADFVAFHAADPSHTPASSTPFPNVVSSYHQLFARLLYRLLLQSTSCLINYHEIVLRKHVMLSKHEGIMQNGGMMEEKVMSEKNRNEMVSKERWDLLCQLLQGLLIQVEYVVSSVDSVLKEALSELMKHKSEKGELESVMLGLHRMSLVQACPISAFSLLLHSLNLTPMLLALWHRSPLYSSLHCVRGAVGHLGHHDPHLILLNSKHFVGGTEKWEEWWEDCMFEHSKQHLFQPLSKLVGKSELWSRKVHSCIVNLFSAPSKLRIHQVHVSLRWLGLLHCCMAGKVLTTLVLLLLPLPYYSTSRLVLRKACRFAQVMLATPREELQYDNRLFNVDGLVLKVHKERHRQLHHLLVELSSHLNGVDADHDDGVSRINDVYSVVKECVEKGTQLFECTLLLQNLSNHQVHSIFHRNSMNEMNFLTECLRVYSKASRFWRHSRRALKHSDGGGALKHSDGGGALKQLDGEDMSEHSRQIIFSLLETVLLQKLQEFLNSQNLHTTDGLSNTQHLNNAQTILEALQAYLSSKNILHSTISSLAATATFHCMQITVNCLTTNIAISPSFFNLSLHLLNHLIPSLDQLSVTMAAKLLHRSLILLNPQVAPTRSFQVIEGKEEMACRVLLSLVDEMVKDCNSRGLMACLPLFSKSILKDVIIGLSRNKGFNDCLHFSLELWNLQYMPVKESNHSRSLPSSFPQKSLDCKYVAHEFLQEIDMLEDYITRVNIIGWTSRQQFEETWMALLSTLNYNLPSQLQFDSSRQQATSIRCINSLLLSTLLSPVPGHPCSSIPLHLPRPPLPILNERVADGLMGIHGEMSRWILKNVKHYSHAWSQETWNDEDDDCVEEDGVRGLDCGGGERDVFMRHNLEREIDERDFMSGQLSVCSLKTRMREKDMKEGMLMANGVFTDSSQGNSEMEKKTMFDRGPLTSNVVTCNIQLENAKVTNTTSTAAKKDYFKSPPPGTTHSPTLLNPKTLITSTKTQILTYTLISSTTPALTTESAQLPVTHASMKATEEDFSLTSFTPFIISSSHSLSSTLSSLDVIGKDVISTINTINNKMLQHNSNENSGLAVSMTSNLLSTYPSISNPSFTTLQSTSIDIHSCLQFLFELYASILSPSPPSNHPASNLLSYETSRSIVLLSDLFSSRMQVQGMKDMSQDLEPFSSFHLLSIAKATAILSNEGDVMDDLAGLLEEGIGSNDMSVKVLSLHAGLYLFQHLALPACVINAFVPYLLKTLSFFNTCSIYNQTHVLAMFSLAFSILLLNSQVFNQQDFCFSFVQICLSKLSLDLPTPILLGICSGLERLIVTRILPQTAFDTLCTLASHRLMEQNSQKSMIWLRLFLTCFYQEQNLQKGDLSESMEKKIKIIGTITMIFEKVRKSGLSEALCVLRSVEGMLACLEGVEGVNVVVAELLSPHQPHPQLFSQLLFTVCEVVKNKEGMAALVDWVLLSLDSLCQRRPLSAAVWSLSCVFVSCSQSVSLKARYALVVSRMGRLEAVDWWLLCTSACHFHIIMQQMKHPASSSFIASFAKMPLPPLFLQLLLEKLQRTPV